MTLTSRERVTRCLTFQRPDRIPRDLWTLPWFGSRYPEELAALRKRFPGDFGYPRHVYAPSSRVRGEMFAQGTYVDDWGCRFHNIQPGVHGEVREPVLPDLADWRQVKPPYETLPASASAARETVRRDCGDSTAFLLAGCCPRPWERHQFLRGSENAMLDVMDPGPDTLGLLKVIHDFYLREVEFWASTEVDAIRFMDDWGSQLQLLIPPPVWRALFKPMYKAYCDLAHARGKFAFMHSDGHIAEIMDDLVEIGVDAVNSQLFCMDMGDLARRVKGKITFWGEIDRQHVLTSPDPRVAREAVRRVAGHFYDPRGGVIAQFEAGPGTRPEAAEAIFDEWEKVGAESGPG